MKYALNVEGGQLTLVVWNPYARFLMSSVYQLTCCQWAVSHADFPLVPL